MSCPLLAHPLKPKSFGTLHAKIRPMTEPQQASHSAHAAETKPGAKPPAKIHRVCIGCNNMFEVTMENYEAKHCSVCHKG